MEQKDNMNQETSRMVCYIRLTPSEHQRLQKMIDANGATAPELFRRALFNRNDLEQPLCSREQAREFATELNRQGSNLNQIAKKINIGLYAGWYQSLTAVNINYMKLIQMLTVNYAHR